MRVYEVIKKPVLTEKTYAQIEILNKYTFEVARDANKTEIAQAFHKIFSVKPLAVNIINMKPQSVRTGTKHPGVSSFVKKAVITLPAGTKLNIFGDQEAAAEGEAGKDKDAKETKTTKEVKETREVKETKDAKATKVTKEIKETTTEAKEEHAKPAHRTKTKPIEDAADKEKTHAAHAAKAKTKPIEHDKPAKDKPKAEDKE